MSRFDAVSYVLGRQRRGGGGGATANSVQRSVFPAALEAQAAGQEEALNDVYAALTELAELVEASEAVSS